jgi:very-short-patch-repair endonuclease
MQQISTYNFEGKDLNVYGDSEEPWFMAREVLEFLGYSKESRPYKDYKKEWKKVVSFMHPRGGPQKTTFINKPAVQQLICTTRKSVNPDFLKLFGVEMYNRKVECIESETLSAIKKSFSGIRMIEQHSVLEYRIDLYLPDHNLVIECDEHGHGDRDLKYERKRQRRITRVLGCKFLRFNPDASDFNVFVLINQIFTIITAVVDSGSSSSD